MMVFSATGIYMLTSGTAPITGLICGAPAKGAFTTIGTTGVIRTRTTMARSWSADCTAPVLALISIAKLRSVWLGIAYLLLFSLGVLLTMLLFGCLLGQLMARLTRFGAVCIAGIRSTVALGTIGLGTHMLYGG